MIKTFATLTLLAVAANAQNFETVHNVAAGQLRILKGGVPTTKKAALTYAAVAGVTAALYFTADKPSADYFKTRAIGGSALTKYAIIATPAVVYGLGLLKHDSYTRDTAVYAVAAAVDAQMLTLVGKRLTNRISPNGMNTGGVFPSSHTATAFAVASVIAHRTHNKWVKVAAYGGAAAIGVGTIAMNGHYPTDVFVGAALGYSVGKAF